MDSVVKELVEIHREMAEIKGTLAEVLSVLHDAPQNKRGHESDEEEEAPQKKRPASRAIFSAERPQQLLSEERTCAEALMMACDERLGAQSPAALMVCDTFLARDFWTSFVHQSYLPPAASQVWAWGKNRNGQLGTGDTENRPTPTEITALHGRCIHAVACGSEHTMAVVDDGELWATGNNGHGQLGLGDTQKRRSFTRVSGLSGRKVAAVACGGFHTLALLESGELFAWGDNNFGQLGLGDNTDRTTPEPVAALSGRRVAAIACGWYHSVAVLETGELFAWGGNFCGQLGLGDFENRNESTQVTALAGRRVVAVACGGNHTAAVLESGELFTWGRNDQGQLGHDDRTGSKNTPQLVEALRSRPVIAVACGDHHTLALLKTGEVFAWGWNEEGQLGLGEFSEDPISTPQQVHFFDGSKRVMSIHCGDFFSGAVLKSGELFLWGDNDFGQLGTGDEEKRATPTLVTNLTAKHVLSIAFGTEHNRTHPMNTRRMKIFLSFQKETKLMKAVFVCLLSAAVCFVGGCWAQEGEYSLVLPEIAPRVVRFKASADFVSADPAAVSARENLTRAFVCLHGSDINWLSYYDTARTAVEREYGSVDAAKMLVVAPRICQADYDASIVVAANEVYWNGSSWSAGGLSTTDLPAQISSFALMDRLLEKIVSACPSVRDVVLAGHSAGGQFVVRYALLSELDLGKSGVHLRYIVGNPSSYAYLDEKRPTIPPLDSFDCSPFVVPADASTCTYYNVYRYGIDHWEYVPYASIVNVSAEQAVKRFATRDVVYLLGQNDTCNELLDPTCDSHGLATSCSAMDQGRWRLERGRCFCDHLDSFYGHSATNCGPHIAAEVPDVPHSSYRLFTYDLGREQIFRVRRNIAPSESGDDGKNSDGDGDDDTSGMMRNQARCALLLFVVAIASFAQWP